MKNLVICCVGDKSLHRFWLNTKNRNYKVFLVYYGDIKNKWKNTSDYYLEMKGTKWQLLYFISKNYSEEISKFKSIWLPDDDILVHGKKLNKLFKIFNDRDLLLAQPALSFRSHISHKITRRKIFGGIRYTNFVEIMVPIFSQKAFEICSPTFNENLSGWGLDFYWPHLINSKIGRNRIAIIDKIPVTHTRKINSPESFYKKFGIVPKEEMFELFKKHNIKFKY